LTQAPSLAWWRSFWAENDRCMYRIVPPAGVANLPVRPAFTTARSRVRVLVELGEDWIVERMGGSYQGHGQFYHDYHDRRDGFAWAIWDDGRIAGIEAEGQGEFWTQREDCTGCPIEINARTTRAGSVEVELWDCVAGGKPITGFTFDECIPFRGDELWAPLRWKGKADLSELKGRTIQLHIRLCSAKVFGYRLACDSGTVSP